MEKDCIPLCLWIKWSSKLVLWPFKNFHHWTVTKIWFHLSQFPFTYPCLKKNQSLQSSEIWTVADQKLMNLSGDPGPVQFGWVSRHRIWRIGGLGIPPSDIPFISLFDSDVEFILARKHLSQQPLQSIHMSIIQATIRKLVTASVYWVLAMCHAYTTWVNLIQ